jgi:hypothetical protein
VSSLPSFDDKKVSDAKKEKRRKERNKERKS